jgi:UDP-glucose 4-epimerase
MRALVTGGAGYIGSNLVDRLMAEGYRVTVVDDLSRGKLGNLDQHTVDPRFKFVQGSIMDLALMDQLVGQVDVVYHLAAVVGVKYVVENPLHGIRTNVRGTENVIESAHKHGARIVIASSSEVYGKSESVPWDEESDRLLGPTSVARWSYSDSKAIDEYVGLAYHKTGGLPVSIVRYFNSYGPRLDPNGYGSVIARFITQALSGEPLTVFGDGMQTRSFTYVTDTVEGTYQAGVRPEAVGLPFNIGSARETSILELAHLICQIVGCGANIQLVPFKSAFGDGFEAIPRRVPDMGRAEQLLGFSAQVPLEDGLFRTVEWFRANPGQ